MTYIEPQAGPVDADDLQRLDNVLADTATPSLTRKALITRAAVGAAGLGAQGKLPNNLGFMQYKTHMIGGIVANLEHAGIGFGKRGKGAGRFYHYHRPPHHALARIADNAPR